MQYSFMTHGRGAKGIAKRRGAHRGFIALISVLITGSLLLLLGVGSVFRGVDSLNTVSGEESSFRASLAADACAEEALMKLRDDLGYVGNELILVEEGVTCTILPILGSGNTLRTLRANATVNGYVRTTMVEITQVNPMLVISRFETIP